jgi:hypothetical protein
MFTAGDLRVSGLKRDKVIETKIVNPRVPVASDGREGGCGLNFDEMLDRPGKLSAQGVCTGMIVKNSFYWGWHWDTSGVRVRAKGRCLFI